MNPLKLLSICLFLLLPICGMAQQDRGKNPDLAELYSMPSGKSFKLVATENKYRTYFCDIGNIDEALFNYAKLYMTKKTSFVVEVKKNMQTHIITLTLEADKITEDQLGLLLTNILSELRTIQQSKDPFFELERRTAALY